MKELLKKDAVIIVLGTGGVGKTTIAASLALAGATSHLNTAVATCDPARRLRDALGLERLGGKPTPIGAQRLASAGFNPDLKLSAMLLDVKGAWDGLVERFVSDPQTRQRIMDNPFYRALTEQFAGSDAYAALEQLYDQHIAREFDLQIVDTPPAAHAFEFLQAPARLTRLLDSRAARWLFTPYMSASRFAMRLASRAGRFVVRELENFAGTKVLSSISEFFIAAAEAVEGVVDRLKKTEALLRASSVHFVLVTTPQEDRLHQATDLIEQMRVEKLHLRTVVVNRFADEQTWDALASSKNGIPDNLRALPKVAQALQEQSPADAGIRNLAGYLAQYHDRTVADIGRLSRFARELPPSVELLITPEIQVEVGDLRSLARISKFLTDAPLVASRLKAVNDSAEKPARGARSENSDRRKAEGLRPE
jgi:anion-transporting  ArsA/GET3 family ATPase